MAASRRVVRSAARRTLFGFFLVCGFLTAPVSGLVADELDNLQFRLPEVRAAYGENSVRLPFLVENVPPGSPVESLGFRVNFDPRNFLFTGANALVPGNIYIVDESADEDGAYVQLEVHLSDNGTLHEGAIAILYLHPIVNVETDGLEDAKQVSLPLELESGENTWIKVAGHEPLLPVPNLIGGSVTIDLKDGVELGTAAGVNAGMVEIPLAVTAVHPLWYLEVGIDYDEDMMEFLTVLVTDEMQDFVDAVETTTNEGLLRVRITFNDVGCPSPTAALPTLRLRFWIKEHVPAETRLMLGAGFGEVLTRRDGLYVPLSLYSPGTVVVEANSSRHFKRGDVNFDDRINTSDAVRVLGYLFGDEGELPCRDVADFDDNGTVSLVDVTSILAYVFRGDDPPAAPFPAPGLDPTYDDLGVCND